uniref:Uncharacterized protein n=1 Tax=Onchocerca volvulus TaxID=6282 RepID=A0A8R1TWX8_ONCVO
MHIVQLEMRSSIISDKMNDMTRKSKKRLIPKKYLFKK